MSPDIFVGDVVRDPDDDDPDEDAVLLVTSRYVKRADEYAIATEPDGTKTTVADVNPDYPADDRVIGVAYVYPHTMNVGHKREYAFPRSRLEVVYSPHDSE